MRVIQKVLRLTQKELEKQDSFSLFFNALGPMMLKHCNPIPEGGILVPLKLLHSTYDFIIVSKMVTTHGI